jgi:hypothetical protein
LPRSCRHDDDDGDVVVDDDEPAVTKPVACDVLVLTVVMGNVRFVVL